MRQLKLLVIVLSGILLHSCTEAYTGTMERYSDTLRIKQDLEIITKTFQSRNYLNRHVLNFVADYVFDEFSEVCDTVYFQSYTVNGIKYKNVIGIIGINYAERLVIGAHYDVAGDQEGADDNASGVSGVLELARLLSKKQLKQQIELVAYTLEEPPFFKTKFMGSYIHAKSLYDKGIKIKGMICLESIGYFNDKPKSQTYPIGFLKVFYGNKGDYITVVQNFGNGLFGRQVKSLMKKQHLVKTKSFKSPSFFPGVDLSDHLNYWKHGYNAVMITNSAFYRNKNYHKKTDRMETLDLRRMSLVIDEVYLTVLNL